VITVILLLFVPIDNLHAQFGIGVSYEKREVTTGNSLSSPEYGFGVRLENDFGPRIPLIKLGWRIYASAFSMEEEFNEQLNDVLENNVNAVIVDAGFSLFLEVKMPLFVNPYAGAGLGYESRNSSLTSGSLELLNEETTELQTLPMNINSNALYYHGFVGMKLSPIPIFKPFVEYRYTGVTEVGDLNKIPGRLLFGITLEF
jgi:hypothetical protein